MTNLVWLKAQLEWIFSTFWKEFKSKVFFLNIELQKSVCIYKYEMWFNN